MALISGLNIGVGLLVLLILWVASVLAIVALAAVPKARFAIPFVIVASLVVSLVLLFYPRASPDQPTTSTEDVDELFFGRLVLLLVMLLFVIGGGVIIFVFHCIETIHAGNKQTYFITS